MANPFTSTAVPPISTLVPQPNQVGFANGRPRNRLGQEGFAILERYWSKWSSSSPLVFPPLNDRKVITGMIKALPGCDHWNQSRTNDWFRRRIKKLQHQGVEPTKEEIKHLQVLMQSQPNPSPDLIRTWATLLARDGGSGAVDFWIEYITVALHIQTAPYPFPAIENPHANLPTPDGTPIPKPPTPIYRTMHTDDLFSHPKIKQDPSVSPIIPSLIIQTHPSTTEDSPQSPYQKLEPISPLIKTEQTEQTPTRVSFRTILKEAFLTPDHMACGVSVPNDADDFVAMFSPYEIKLSTLLRKLESGQ